MSHLTFANNRSAVVGSVLNVNKCFCVLNFNLTTSFSRFTLQCTAYSEYLIKSSSLKISFGNFTQLTIRLLINQLIYRNFNRILIFTLYLYEIQKF